VIVVSSLPKQFTRKLFQVPFKGMGFQKGRLMRVLELGNYVSVAYAGMLLAEQGFEVFKLTNGKDPILELNQGAELWEWINYRKIVLDNPVSELASYISTAVDIVLDNFRPSTLANWHLDPVDFAHKWNCVWVSLRSEIDEISFDMVAQCRSTLEYGPYVPFYLGDTSAGLWMSFKALSMLTQGKRGEHAILGQASCLQKLVEGELLFDSSGREGVAPPWDQPESYYFDNERREGVVHFKGREYREPVRDTAWKRDHLWHDQGRMKI